MEACSSLALNKVQYTIRRYTVVVKGKIIACIRPQNFKAFEDI
jgi:hypothetical protein